MTVTRIPAYGGDRAANLEGIADEMERLSHGGQPEEIRARRLVGYAEQLRIIADELRKAQPS